MMSHVKIVQPRKDGKPTRSRIPREAGVRPASGADSGDTFFAAVYADDYLLARAQQDPTDHMP